MRGQLRSYKNSYLNDPGREYRLVKKNLRQLFRKYKTLSEEDVNLCIDFYVKLFHLKPKVNKEEFKYRVKNRLIKDHTISKNRDESLFTLIGFEENYPEELYLILRFHLFLISLRQKGRIRIQEGYYLYEENSERALIFPLPSLSRAHPYYIEESLRIIKMNLNQNNKKIFLFKSKSNALSCFRVLLNEGIRPTDNNLFFYLKDNYLPEFVQFKLK